MNSLLAFLGQSEFQIAFWSSLLSSLIISLAAALLLNRATDLFKKPNLRAVVKQDGYYRNSIKLSRNAKGSYSASFRFAVRNDGNQTLLANEGMWHTYVSETGKKTIFSVQDESNHQRGLIDYPVYPESFIDVGPQWSFETRQGDPMPTALHYFFSTNNYGYFPKTVRMDPETGKVLFIHMGKVEFEFPEKEAYGAGDKTKIPRVDQVE